VSDQSGPVEIEARAFRVYEGLLTVVALPDQIDRVSLTWLIDRVSAFRDQKCGREEEDEVLGAVFLFLVRSLHDRPPKDVDSSVVQRADARLDVDSSVVQRADARLDVDSSVVQRADARLDVEAWQREVILHNVAKDACYAPYCMRCRGLVRMQRVEQHYWKCHCGTLCDYR